MVLVELSFRGIVFVELRIWGCVRACEGDGAIAYRCVMMMDGKDDDGLHDY